MVIEGFYDDRSFYRNSTGYNSYTYIFTIIRFREIKSDVLVCVFGPQSIHKLLLNDNLFKIFNDLKIKTDLSGIVVNKNFQSVSHKNLYFIGFHASGYNPNRKTIIKAIVKNSKIASINLKNNISIN